MKSKIGYLVLSISAALFLSILGVTEGMTKDENQDLSFAAKTNKEIFTLGEPVRVEFVLTNEGATPVKVPEQGVESGSLKIYIANQDREYKEYFASGWGREMGNAVTLEPGKSHSYYATILWNGKPNVSHLNENAAKQVLAGKITTEYALPTPGVYFIKGVSSISSNENEAGFKPVKVVFNDPTGIELEVWNQIKGNQEIALLMQTGGFNTDKAEIKQQLIEQVEQILLQHPNSVYSSYLRPNLEKYKADEARRNKLYKN